MDPPWPTFSFIVMRFDRNMSHLLLERRSTSDQLLTKCNLLVAIGYSLRPTEGFDAHFTLLSGPTAMVECDRSASVRAEAAGTGCVDCRYFGQYVRPVGQQCI